MNTQITRSNGLLDGTLDRALSELLRDTSFKTAKTLGDSIIKLTPKPEEAVALGKQIASALNKEINKKILPALYNRNPIIEGSETFSDIQIDLYRKITNAVPNRITFSFDIPALGKQTVTLDARTTFKLALPFSEFQKIFFTVDDIKKGFTEEFETNLRSKVSNVAGLGFVGGVVVGSLFSLTMIHLIQSANK